MMLRHPETRNSGRPLLPLGLKEPGKEAILKSQSEPDRRGRNAYVNCAPGGMQLLPDLHQQVREAAGENKCSHHSLHISSDFLLGPPNGYTEQKVRGQWSLGAAIHSSFIPGQK